MPMEDEMTIDERRKYVKLMATRYQKAKRKERSQLLTEMEQVTQAASETFDPIAQWGPAWSARNVKPLAAHLWLEVERMIAASVGESGLYLCRAAHPQFSEDGPASSHLWCAGAAQRKSKANWRR